MTKEQFKKALHALNDEELFSFGVLRKNIDWFIDKHWRIT